MPVQNEDRMKKRLLFLLLPALCACLIAGIGTTAQQETRDINSCVECHSNAEKMKASGFPQFAMPSQEIDNQTRMPASCTNCHLGVSSDTTKDGAHKGLLRLFYVRSKGLQAVTRDKLEKFEPESIVPRGKNPMISLLPVKEKNGKMIKDPENATILFHDKNPRDLSFNYDALEKTCGSCHPEKVKELRRTAMGHNTKQALYRTWTEKTRGPHNCGLWFADNYKEIAKNSNMPFTREMAELNQKACNVCHVGCLDCHYAPGKKEPDNPSIGPHTFTRNVASLTCYGGGRGSICHAGPEDRRRGGGYMGGPFSNPAGAAPDIHHAKGLVCTECHDTTAKDRKLLHGQVKRQADCTKCHAGVIKSVAVSKHRNVSCEACHIQDVGAYTGTFWGPGRLAGTKTAFFKYKEYYGVMKEPILIKDQKGRWIPVKPYAMAALNQKSAGGLKPGLAWRFPINLPDLERTDDAYAFVGLLKGLPSNDNVLAWIQMDKLSHKFGKARTCESCHTGNGEQRQDVSWKFADAGAEPFEGGHTVIASKNGLFIKDMRATTEIKAKEGWKIEDFAPWYYLKDKWQVRGDFSIPPVSNKAAYKNERDSYANALKTGQSYHK
jgi:hypothetical protein